MVSVVGGIVPNLPYPAFKQTYLPTAGQEVAAEELVIGSRILIKPGDRSPADGMVVSGATRMDESMLTGEPAPISKRNGDKVGNALQMSPVC